MQLRVSERQIQTLTLAVGRVHRAVSLEEGLLTLCDTARDLARSDWAGAVLHCAGMSDAPLSMVSGPSSPEEAADPGQLLELPLRALEGTAIGVLSVRCPRDVVLAESELVALRQFAQLAACALESVRVRTQLAEQDARLKLALEAAGMGTWEHIPSNHVTHWDARSKAMFGYEPEEAFGFEEYTRALHPDDLPHVLAGIEKVLDFNGTRQCSLQYRIRSRDGAERWVEAHGRCVFGEGGVPLRVNGTLLDITARKCAEESLRESNRRKDEFLAVLGHELRNPLAPICTALELMRMQIPDQALREREVIERQTRHMIRLVDDLLDLARVSRGTVVLKPEVLYVDSLIARAVEMVSPLFESRHQRVEVSVTRRLCVEADAVRLAQVVANLLTNAGRYTPAGGHIQVRAYAELRDRPLAVIEVRDTGIGIEPHEVQSIFEPFVRSAQHTQQGGLGIGLSLVASLVRLHGGTVEAESPGRGHGSCFRVRLPAVRGSAIHEAASAPVSAIQPSQRVLVVDDNLDAAELLATLLELRGFEVQVAHDGPRALECAAATRFDAAVVDLGLPVMDGCELAVRLREAHGTKLRLVALTGYGQLGDRARTQQAGFDAHLVKPVDASELVTALA